MPIHTKKSIQWETFHFWQIKHSKTEWNEKKSFQKKKLMIIFFIKKLKTIQKLFQKLFHIPVPLVWLNVFDQFNSNGSHSMTLANEYFFPPYFSHIEISVDLPLTPQWRCRFVSQTVHWLLVFVFALFFYAHPLVCAERMYFGLCKFIYIYFLH